MGLFVHIGATTSETWLASFLKRLNIVEGQERQAAFRSWYF